VFYKQVEEEKRRHRDILSVFDRLQKKSARKAPNMLVLDPYGKRCRKWKRMLMKLELIILCDLGFQIKFSNPHKYLLNYTSVLEADEKVSQKAWSYLNDSLRLPRTCEINPEVLACSAIYLAAKYFQLQLPDKPPWHQLFGASWEEIDHTSRMMMELYKIPPRYFEKMSDSQDPDAGSEVLEAFALPVHPKKKKRKTHGSTKEPESKKRKIESQKDEAMSSKNSSSEPHRSKTSKKRWKSRSTKPSRSRSRSRRKHRRSRRKRCISNAE